MQYDPHLVKLSSYALKWYIKVKLMRLLKWKERNMDFTHALPHEYYMNDNQLIWDV